MSLTNLIQAIGYKYVIIGSRVGSNAKMPVNMLVSALGMLMFNSKC